jgi:hypothetical protein
MRKLIQTIFNRSCFLLSAYSFSGKGLMLLNNEQKVQGSTYAVASVDKCDLPLPKRLRAGRLNESLIVILKLVTSISYSS